MSRVPKFGFSAFLKFICSNEKPQKRILRERHNPNKSGGYDFHKSMRRGIQRMAFDGASYEQVAASFSSIKNPPERISALKCLKEFDAWMKIHKASLSSFPEIVFSSPNGVFNISFRADFIAEMGGRVTAVHVWNTNHKLSSNLVLCALCLVAQNAPLTPSRPDDFAVLSMRDGRIYKWSDATKEHGIFAEKLMLNYEKVCHIVRDELKLPSIKDDKRDGPHP